MIGVMSSSSTARARPVRPGTLVQRARLDNNMTQTAAMARFARLASQHGMAVPATTSLKRMFSRWENQPVIPDADYRMLLRELYGRTDDELGFPADTSNGEADGHAEAVIEIRARLASSQGVDGALIAHLDQGTHRLRLLDRRSAHSAKYRCQPTGLTPALSATR